VCSQFMMKPPRELFQNKPIRRDALGQVINAVDKAALSARLFIGCFAYDIETSFL
jgi:hypothetical protein